MVIGVVTKKARISVKFIEQSYRINSLVSKAGGIDSINNMYKLPEELGGDK